MEICFVPDNDYGRFLRDSRLVERHRGDIRPPGRKLGSTRAWSFTPSDSAAVWAFRRRSRCTWWDLDAASNRVVVGAEADLARSLVSDFELQLDSGMPLRSPFGMRGAIRYNHPGVSAVVMPRSDGTADVRLRTRPGRDARQACVLYGGDTGDVVFGGGWIVK